MRRTEEEAARILEGFEDSHQIFSYTVRGVSVWRLLRFSANITLQNLDLSGAALPKRELFSAVCSGFIDLFNMPRKTGFLALTYASALRVQSARGYQDIYFDRLLESLPDGGKVSSLNAPGYLERIAKAAIRPVLDSSIILVASALLARLLPVRDDGGIFKRIADLVQNELTLVHLSEPFIRRNFSTFWWRSFLYTLLLRRLRPHTVLVPDAGQYPVILACRRLGIKFVELQHGIFSKNHPDALPRTVLQGDTRHLLFPDHVALYGDYWIERLKTTAAAEKGILVSAGSSIIEQYRLRRIHSFQAAPAKPVFTLTTQGFEREALIDFLARFLSLVSFDFALNIKLHPAYDNSREAYLEAFSEDRRVHILKGQENPNTFELIALSDLHMSISSACHFDSVGIGTPTVVIALGGYDLVSDLVGAGDALVVRTPEQLAAILTERSWIEISAERSNRYCRRGFVENIEQLMSRAPLCTTSAKAELDSKPQMQ